MIKFITQQKGKVALIIDTVDRLQRSFRETPILNELMQRDVLELHFVKEGNVLSKDASSTQKLMWNMGVVMAQSYTDQLSDNVKRSMKHKVQSGEWISKAPIGYYNDADKITGKSILTIDRSTSPFIKRVFEEYATGLYSIHEIKRRADDWGLRSRTGKKVCFQMIHKMIGNPFYHGVMVVKGQEHKHHYETVISKSLFDRCQRIRYERSRCCPTTKSKNNFLYQGLITCKASGRLVGCDLKKNRYIYLICRNKDDLTKRVWISERVVTQQIEARLKSLKMSDDHYKKIKLYIEDTHSSQKTKQQETLHQLRQKRSGIECNLDRLTDLVINGTLTQEAYKRKQNELQNKHDLLTLQLEGQFTDSDTVKQSILTMISVLNGAYDLYKSSKTYQKRLLLKTLFANCYLDGEKLVTTLVEAVSDMRNIRSCRKWQGHIDDLRTHNAAELVTFVSTLHPDLLEAINAL
jgi:DNA invertase Pin-like site-specific DNA recombinase